jgi:hypothetical protein
MQWPLLGFAPVHVLLRLAVLLVSLANLNSVPAKVSFTGVVVSSNQVAINGSNYVEDDVVATLTDEEKADAVWGSKMLLALEEFELGTLWLVKACLLLLYNRMTYVIALPQPPHLLIG